MSGKKAGSRQLLITDTAISSSAKKRPTAPKTGKPATNHDGTPTKPSSSSPTAAVAAVGGVTVATVPSSSLSNLKGASSSAASSAGSRKKGSLRQPSPAVISDDNVTTPNGTTKRSVVFAAGVKQHDADKETASDHDHTDSDDDTKQQSSSSSSSSSSSTSTRGRKRKNGSDDDKGNDDNDKTVKPADKKAKSSTKVLSSADDDIESSQSSIASPSISLSPKPKKLMAPKRGAAAKSATPAKQAAASKASSSSAAAIAAAAIAAALPSSSSSSPASSSSAADDMITLDDDEPVVISKKKGSKSLSVDEPIVSASSSSAPPVEVKDTKRGKGRPAAAASSSSLVKSAKPKKKSKTDTKDDDDAAEDSDPSSAVGGVTTDNLNCTMCNELEPEFEMVAHPLLGVPICTKCRDTYNKVTEWEKDDEGFDTWCRWCADGGTMFLCDSCTRVFCHDCVKSNFGRKRHAAFEAADKWNCFACDKSQLKVYHDRLKNYFRRVQLRKDGKLKTPTVKGTKRGRPKKSSGDGSDDDNDTPASKIAAASRRAAKQRQSADVISDNDNDSVASDGGSSGSGSGSGSDDEATSSDDDNDGDDEEEEPANDDDDDGKPKKKRAAPKKREKKDKKAGGAKKKKGSSDDLLDGELKVPKGQGRRNIKALKGDTEMGQDTIQAINDEAHRLADLEIRKKVAKARALRAATLSSSSSSLSSSSVAEAKSEKKKKKIIDDENDDTTDEKASSAASSSTAAAAATSVAVTDDSKRSHIIGVSGDRVEINPYRNDDEDALYIRPSVAGRLKPHQIEGVRFMWDNLIQSSTRMALLKSRHEARETRSEERAARRRAAENAREAAGDSYHESQETLAQRADDVRDELADQAEEERDTHGYGCILAHSMGLGKTLQVISFVEIYLRLKYGEHVLIVVPVNTIVNWEHEFTRWLQPKPVNMHSIRTCKDTPSRLKLMRQWARRGGVLLVGFEQYRNLARGLRVRSIAQRDELTRMLHVQPDLVVIDEAHRIKNPASDMSKVLGEVRTTRRLALTGTPLQNNLMEYYTMVEFVRPSYLGTPVDFRNRFQAPITNGQCMDSTPGDVKLMRQRTYVLHERLRGFIHRVDYSSLRDPIIGGSGASHPGLPPKHEYVIFVRLSPLQRKLYQLYLKTSKSRRLFKAYHDLCKVWNHPDALIDAAEKDKLKSEKKRLKELGDDSDRTDTDEEQFLSDESTDRSSDDDSEKKAVKRKSGKAAAKTKAIICGKCLQMSGKKSKVNKLCICNTCGLAMHQRCASPVIPPDQIAAHQWCCEWCTRGEQHPYSGAITAAVASLKAAVTAGPTGPTVNPDGTSIPSPNGVAQAFAPDGTPIAVAPSYYVPQRVIPTGWWDDVLSSDDAKFERVGDLAHSGKMIIALYIIRETLKRGEKILIFSQALFTLNLLEDMLETYFGFTKKVDYFRLDGATESSTRQEQIDMFNQSDNPAQVFLLSTKAGCLGVNLVGANRVIIFDASWNPANDVQAIFRTYRYGQQRTCYVYRLIASGTMEKKIYERQMVKQGMSLRVVDEQQVERLFNRAQTEELWRYDDEEQANVGDQVIVYDHDGTPHLLDAQQAPMYAHYRQERVPRDKFAEHTTAPRDDIMCHLVQRFAHSKCPGRQLSIDAVAATTAAAAAAATHIDDDEKKKAKKKDNDDGDDDDDDDKDDDKEESDDDDNDDSEKKKKTRKKKGSKKLDPETEKKRAIARRDAKKNWKKQEPGICVTGDWVMCYHEPAVLLEDVDDLHLDDAEIQEAKSSFAAEIERERSAHHPAPNMAQTPVYDMQPAPAGMQWVADLTTGGLYLQATPQTFHNYTDQQAEASQSHAMAAASSSSANGHYSNNNNNDNGSSGGGPRLSSFVAGGHVIGSGTPRTGHSVAANTAAAASGRNGRSGSAGSRNDSNTAGVVAAAVVVHDAEAQPARVMTKKSTPSNGRSDKSRTASSSSSSSSQSMDHDATPSSSSSAAATAVRRAHHQERRRAEVAAISIASAAARQHRRDQMTLERKLAFEQQKQTALIRTRTEVTSLLQQQLMDRRALHAEQMQRQLAAHAAELQRQRVALEQRLKHEEEELAVALTREIDDRMATLSRQLDARVEQEAAQAAALLEQQEDEQLHGGGTDTTGVTDGTASSGMMDDDAPPPLVAAVQAHDGPPPLEHDTTTSTHGHHHADSHVQLHHDHHNHGHGTTAATAGRSSSSGSAAPAASSAPIARRISNPKARNVVDISDDDDAPPLVAPQ